MLYIFTALYCEAAILIRRYHLVKKTENTWLQEFYNEEAGIRLTVTGVGEVAAAAAVGGICSVYRPGQGDMLVNMGVCAHAGQGGGIFLCHKITEQATGRTFYPDMLYRHGFCEKTVVTGMRPWDASAGAAAGCHGTEEVPLPGGAAAGERHGTEGVPLPGGAAAGERHGTEGVPLPGGAAAAGLHGTEGMPLPEGVSWGELYDMEAAAVYQAGSRFFGPHQMVFLKAVSDGGTAKEVSRELVERCMEAYQDRIFGFLEGVLAITCQQGDGEASLPQGEGALVQRFCTDLHCSKAMGDSLREVIRYLTLAGTDYTSVIQSLYGEGLLPCRDKREGKLCFEAFKRRVF